MNKQEFYVGRWLKALKYFGDEQYTGSFLKSNRRYVCNKCYKEIKE